jgi:EAL domain-containing protein (putative c-di-GMP-specific phosphodiesterase class I)
LPDRIQALLQTHWVEPQRLTVEVTESATMVEPARAADVLAALRERHIGVSIDDFGTGNASIAYLTQLPANEIKIDKAFITDLCEDARAEAIASSTVDLAHHLGLRVVAEGIETAAVMQRLVELGCDTGQGYLISRPLAGDDLTVWLTNDGGMRLESPSARGSTPGAVSTAAVRS